MKPALSAVFALSATSMVVGVLAAAGCELSPCTRFEYAPPSATVRILDAESGQELCGRSPTVHYLEADGGVDESEQALYPFENGCGYQFPGWERTLGSPVRRLELEGYEPLAVELPPAEDDACGILVPSELELRVTSAP